MDNKSWATLLAGDPDVLVLPESDPDNVAGLLGADKYQVFSADTQLTGTAIAPVTLLVHERLGEYRLAAEHTISFGALTVEPISGNSPSFTGVHTAPPLPGLMGNWRADLAQVRQLLETGQGAVVAGDFNATLHHGALMPKTAADAALEAGAPEGTWPTDMGGAVSSQIDYIFISNYGANRVAEARTFNPGGSDHRAVTAQLSLCAEHRPVS